MKLYEIDWAIEACIDDETGEILDSELLDSLQMARVDKLENVALWIKNLDSDAAAIREEEKKLAQRRRVAEKKAEHLRCWLQNALQGEKLQTARVAASYRRSERLDVINADDFISWALINERDDLLRYKAPDVDADAVKNAIKGGLDCPYVRIEEKQNLQIK